MKTASVSFWCDIVNAFTKMAVNWLIQFKDDYVDQGILFTCLSWLKVLLYFIFMKDGKRPAFKEWSEYEASPFDGVMFLACHLDKEFDLAARRFPIKSRIFNTCITFYERVSITEYCSVPILKLKMNSF